MILTGDYHTHTVYSHGKGTVLDNALAGEKIGLKEIAITDHGFSHPAFGLNHKKLPNLVKDIEDANKQTNVKVLLGIESNLRGEKGEADLTEKDYQYFDTFLIGMHRFIFFSSSHDWFNFFWRNFFKSTFKIKPSKNLVKLTTNAYINAIKNNPVDVITHLNFLCFSDAVEVAKCARDYGTFIELNAKKVHLSDDEVAKVADTGVKFIIDSDAHTPDRVGEISLVEDLLKRVNIPESQIVNINGKLPEFRFREYKERHI